MALEFDPDKILYDEGREILRFYAKDGEKQIVCAVSRAALMDFARVSLANAADLLAIYRRIDLHVQTIAQYKYLNGVIEPDGIVLVLTGDLK